MWVLPFMWGVDTSFTFKHIHTHPHILQVMGSRPWMWVLPFMWGVDPSFDGAHWDLKGMVVVPQKSPTDSDSEVSIHLGEVDLTLITSVDRSKSFPRAMPRKIRDIDDNRPGASSSQSTDIREINQSKETTVPYDSPRVASKSSLQLRRHLEMCADAQLDADMPDQDDAGRDVEIVGFRTQIDHLKKQMDDNKSSWLSPGELAGLRSKINHLAQRVYSGGVAMSGAPKTIYTHRSRVNDGSIDSCMTAYTNKGTEQGSHSPNSRPHSPTASKQGTDNGTSTNERCSGEVSRLHALPYMHGPSTNSNTDDVYADGRDNSAGVLQHRDPRRSINREQNSHIAVLNNSRKHLDSGSGITNNSNIDSDSARRSNRKNGAGSNHHHQDHHGSDHDHDAHTQASLQSHESESEKYRPAPLGRSVMIERPTSAGNKDDTSASGSWVSARHHGVC
jgi:hypothetical protein